MIITQISRLYLIFINFRKNMICQCHSQDKLYVIRYIIISAFLCHNAHGSTKNHSQSTIVSININRSYSFNRTYFFNSPFSTCNEPTSPKNIVLATFSGVVLLVGIVGNLMVILVILYTRLRKQPGYILVSSLAAADLGVSFFVTTVKVHMYIQNGNFCSDLSFCTFCHIRDCSFLKCNTRAEHILIK